MPNNLKKMEFFDSRYLDIGNWESEIKNWNIKCSLLEKVMFLVSKISKLRNQKIDFNITPKKEFMLYNFRSRESETLNKFENT